MKSNLLPQSTRWGILPSKLRSWCLTKDISRSRVIKPVYIWKLMDLALGEASCLGSVFLSHREVLWKNVFAVRFTISCKRRSSNFFSITMEATKLIYIKKLSYVPKLLSSYAMKYWNLMNIRDPLTTNTTWVNSAAKQHTFQVWRNFLKARVHIMIIFGEIN